MRKTPILLGVMYLLITFNLAHSDKISQNKGINDGEIVNVKTQLESKIIVGDGATVIIISNDETNARVIAKVMDISKGGVIRELHNGEDINANINTQTEKAVAAIKNEIALPTEFTVGRAYPNPFNPVVNVQFGLPKEAQINILIYDISGRLMGDYSIGNRSAGWHEFSWNAVDMLGQDVGTGIYLLTIQAGDKLQKQKITYIK